MLSNSKYPEVFTLPLQSLPPLAESLTALENRYHLLVWERYCHLHTAYCHSLKLLVLCRLQIRLLYIVTVTVSLCYSVTVHYHMFQKLVQCAFPLKPHKFFKGTNTKKHLGGLACKDNPPLLKFLSIDIIPPFWSNGKRWITLLPSDS